MSFSHILGVIGVKIQFEKHFGRKVHHQDILGKESALGTGANKCTVLKNIHP
jgi:hypothetical protein